MRPGRALPRVARSLLLLAGASGLAGCMDRMLVIDSRPSGAKLVLNGKDRGLTPQTIHYVHEGRFEVRLEKEGYESLAEEFVTPTRIDAVPGPDAIIENLPGPTPRVTRRTFDLAPLKRESYSDEEVQAVLRQAQSFRADARRSFEEPGTPQPTQAPAPRVAPGAAPLPRPPAEAAPTDAISPAGAAGPRNR